MLRRQYYTAAYQRVCSRLCIPVTYIVFTAATYSWGAHARSARGDMQSGPGGDVRANAIGRFATSSVGAKPAAWPLLWRKRRNHRSWPISAGKGQG